MLGEVHKHRSTSNIPTSRRKLQCSVCKTISAKSVPCICDPGHGICVTWQDTENTLNRTNEDYATPKRKHTALVNKFSCTCMTNLESTSQDLACGDNEKLNNTRLTKYEKLCGIKAKNNDDSKSNVTEKQDNNDDKIKTIITYKNDNYQGNKSSGNSNLENLHTQYKSLSLCNNEQKCRDVTTRPIVCPVTNCAKMVALDSVVLHFYFDHSKIPRMVLKSTESQQITIKSAKLRTDTNCIGIFSLQTETCPLLLMVAKTPSPKIEQRKCKTNPIFTRNEYTQTEVTFEEKGIAINEICDTKSGSSKHELDNDEVLLLWLCKLDDKTNVYSVTLAREDNKLCHSYTGEAVHIRHKQDAFSIHKRSECLSVEGVAANRLFDNHNQFHVIISIVQ